MEILGSQSLWKQNYKNEPFNMTIAYTRKVDAVTEYGIYYNGLSLNGKVVRIFSRLLLPVDSGKRSESAACTILEADENKDFEFLSSPSDSDVIKSKLGCAEKCAVVFKDVNPSPLSDLLLERGFAVLEVDFAGLDSPHSTVYPKVLDNCIFTESTEVDDIMTSKHYVWAYSAWRALRLAKEISDSVIIIGLGIGGSAAFKTLICKQSAECAVFLGDIIPEVTAESDNMLAYRASLDNATYAPLSEVPTLILSASNAADNSFTKMSKLAANTKSLDNYVIMPRADTGEKFSECLPVIFKYIDDHINKNPVHAMPQLTFSNSEGMIYFTVDEAPDIKTMSLLIATASTEARYRNWTNLKLTRSGAAEWFAKCNVYSADIPLSAFVYSEYKDGYISCSPVVYAYPKALGIEPKQKVPRRLLYSGDDGIEDWYSPVGTPYIAEGALKIEGVTAKSNILLTYKPGDFLYTATRDNTLQLTIFGLSQSLTLEVTDSNGVVYSAIYQLKGDDWQKVSLSHENFKSSVKPLESFSDVVCLKLIGEADFMINSILWV